ncbi:MAG: mannose-6-phosphate isomerase, class I [Cellulomonadaceae bacterium]|jgi:mannose-6-phosphate isomerase|nr:mannose-6-phosphate isomerase, class I [Cellulomonadaceae bacterium]
MTYRADLPQTVFALDTTIQTYDWGSRTAIADLLGLEPDGNPQAELWMGTHPAGPSVALLRGGERVLLGDVIAQDPIAMLGERVSNEFGPRLPYLFKILAADKALSVQSHPLDHVARAGFNRDNAAGLTPNAPGRTYSDPRHKPEMIYALTEFAALAGFRDARAARHMLADLDGGLAERLREALAAPSSNMNRAGAQAIRAAFAVLMDARLADTGTMDCRGSDDVAEVLASVQQRLDSADPSLASARQLADRAVLRLAEEHPGDPCVLAPYLMNHVLLKQGEALYIPPSVAHAYLHGVGAEIMASSDNVIRGGLTSKRVDGPAFLEVTRFDPGPAEVLTGAMIVEVGHVQTLRVPVPEFALTVIDSEAGWPLALPERGPRIALSVVGDVELITAAGEHRRLRQGSAVFVAHAAGAVSVIGDGRIVVGWTP